MAYNTIASVGKLTLTDYMDFAKRQNRVGLASLTRNDSNHLDVKLKVCEKDDNKDFRMLRNFRIGEADFSQFKQLRNQLVLAAKNFRNEGNFATVLLPTMSKYMNEQLKLAHKLTDIVERANKKICVTLLRYNVENPRSSYVQV